MPDPYDRERTNDTSFLARANAYNWTLRTYWPNGSLSSTRSKLGCLVSPGRSQYVYDQVHPKRHDKLAYGRGLYPSSYMFNYVADLSELVTMNDYSLGDGQTVVFDSTTRPRLFPSLASLDDRKYTVMLDRDYLPLVYPLRVPSSITNTLSEQAWNYFSDVFPTEVNFSEFAQGLFQLQALVPEIGESIGKTISGGYLNKKFGWDNLLSDLNKLGGIFQTVTDRMEYLHRTYGVPTRLGFARHVEWSPPSGSQYPFGSDPRYFDQVAQNVLVIKVTPVNFRATFRATAWIYQLLDYISDFTGFLRVMTGALGLNNPVKAFWNVIPLSFVVDWFFNISQHLDNLTRLNPPVGWDVNDVTQSVTQNYTLQIDQATKYGRSDYYLTGRTSMVPVEVYERQVGLSFEWALLNPDELSTTQLSLLLAMLHQFG